MLLLLFFLFSDEDPLSLLDLRETQGAAAGYVEDAACGKCHPLLFESYQAVGMSQSFKRPTQAKVIESFGKSFTHEPSNRIYHIRKQGEKLIFHRHVENGKGQAFLTFEEEIDWVMGSGNRARSYLIQTDYGEMIQVPLGWYSEINDWGMSPGFESRIQPGLTRLVRRECMFCHNAFPEVPVGSDRFDQPHVFPKNLPGGTGCQRCHGPGAEHIRASLRQDPIETIRSHIINPKKLEPIQRDSVCFQCHMLPSVTIIGTRKSKHDYAFRPGQDISGYLAHVEVWDEAGERFEINHHGYRFWQSACFQKSSGELGCISCHDPHIKPKSSDFRKKVSNVCLSCHPKVESKHGIDGWKDDCAHCHMPQSRTADVVLVTMTDHRIVKGPVDHDQLVEPIKPSNPTISDIRVLPFGAHYQEDQFFYRLASPLRIFPQESSFDALNQWLEKRTSPEIAHYYRLKAALDLGKYELALTYGNQLKEKGVDWATLEEWIGLANLGKRDGQKAVSHLLTASQDGGTPENYYNLGLAYFLINDLKLGLESLDKAIELRPHFFPAWVYRGRILKSLKRDEESVQAFIQALTFGPAYAPAYKELINLLRRLGRDDEAANYLEIGLKCASDPKLLKPLIRP